MADQWSLFDERPTCATCGRRIDGPRWQAINREGATVIVCPMCAHNPEYDRKRQMP